MKIKPKFRSLYDGTYVGSTHHLLVLEGWEPVDNCDDADVIIFNGGEDIGTELYHEHPIQRGIPHLPSNRDNEEADIFEDYCGSDKLLIGICRGAQFLNVMNGGGLWQDVNNHGHSHTMRVQPTGEYIEVTSTHHQMMRPAPHGNLIGVSHVSTHKQAQHDTYDNPVPGVDAEIVWYPDTGSLCVQGHPEYVPGSRFAEYFFELAYKCLEEIRYAVDA